MESISEALDKAFGKLPEWTQVTLITLFDVLCGA